MARAIRLGVEGGRLAYRSGRIPRRLYAQASTPEDGVAQLRKDFGDVYAGRTVDDGWMGHGRAEVTPADIDRAIALAWRAWWLMFADVALAAVLMWA